VATIHPKTPTTPIPIAATHSTTLISPFSQPHNVNLGNFLDSDDDDDDDDFDTFDLQSVRFGSAEEQKPPAKSAFSLEGLKSKISEWKKTIGDKMQQLIETKQQNENLTQNVSNLLLQKQYNVSSYRLPIVIKSIQSTQGVKPPRGLYYISKTGRKMYLNESQRRKWLNGDEIAGCIEGCNKESMKIH
jgi:hypothetical protein